MSDIKKVRQKHKRIVGQSDHHAMRHVTPLVLVGKILPFLVGKYDAICVSYLSYYAQS